MSAVDPEVASLDERLLAFARGGDADALESVLGESAERAHAQAMRLLGNAADADDPVQEAFLQLVRTIARYDGSVPAAAWIGRLVHDAALMAARARGRRRRREEAAMRDTRGDASSHGVDADAVREAVAELGEADRRAISLFHLAGLSQDEAARALGITANALAVRLHRARERLRHALQRRGIASPAEAALGALVAMPIAAGGADHATALADAVRLGRPLPPSRFHLPIHHQVLHAMRTHPLLTGAAILAAIAATTVPLAAAQRQDGPPPAAVAAIRAPELRWNVIGPRGGLMANAPILAGDALLVSSDRELQCLDRATGALRWKTDVDCGTSLPTFAGGLVIVPLKEAVAALDPRDGSARWRAELVASGILPRNWSPSGSLTTAGDLVIVPGKRLAALDARTGKVAWTSAPAENFFGSPVVAGDALICRESMRSLTCIALADGKGRWSLPFAGIDTYDPPAVAGDTVYASRGASDGTPDELLAVAVADGKPRWRITMDDDLLGNPVAAGEVLVVSGSAGIHAFARAGGARRWTHAHALHSAQYLAVDDGGTVWVGERSGALVGLAGGSGAVAARIDLDALGKAAKAPTMTISTDATGRESWVNGDSSGADFGAQPGAVPNQSTTTIGMVSRPLIAAGTLYAITASGWTVALATR